MSEVHLFRQQEFRFEPLEWSADIHAYQLLPTVSSHFGGGIADLRGAVVDDLLYEADEFAYVLSGSWQIRVQGRELQAGPGDLVLLETGATASTRGHFLCFFATLDKRGAGPAVGSGSVRSFPGDALSFEPAPALGPGSQAARVLRQGDNANLDVSLVRGQPAVVRSPAGTESVIYVIEGSAQTEGEAALRASKGDVLHVASEHEAACQCSGTVLSLALRA